MEKPWTIDAHCHWSDPRVFAASGAEMSRLIAAGLRGFQLGGVDPADWARQTELRERFPGRVWRAFGLHPYFVAAGKDLESAWQKLLTVAPECEALGEMGLDFRAPFARGAQLDFFVRQLGLARELNKPVVLHIVRAHEEALQALASFSVSGMVHAFSGGPLLAARYLQLGYHLSFGTKIMFPNNKDLHESVRQTPLPRILLESDCPDQPPPGQTTHDSASVWAVAEVIAELKSLPFALVVEQTRENFLSLIGKETVP